MGPNNLLRACAVERTGGGFGMACHNYDGDMLTDEVAQARCHIREDHGSNLEHPWDPRSSCCTRWHLTGAPQPRIHHLAAGIWIFHLNAKNWESNVQSGRNLLEHFEATAGTWWAKVRMAPWSRNLRLPMELYLGTAPMQRCMRRKRCNDGMWVKTPRWRTCGICTFVVRTKHEGMQGNDLRVERMVDYWHLAFVFDGISMYLLVMQYRMGLLWNLQGSGNCPLFCG